MVNLQLNVCLAPLRPDVTTDLLCSSAQTARAHVNDDKMINCISSSRIELEFIAELKSATIWTLLRILCCDDLTTSMTRRCIIYNHGEPSQHFDDSTHLDTLLV